jgi:hypothetical protein
VDGLLVPIQIPLLPITHGLDHPVSMGSITPHLVNKLVLVNRRTALLSGRLVSTPLSMVVPHRTMRPLGIAIAVAHLPSTTSETGTGNATAVLATAASSSTPLLVLAYTSTHHR